MIRVKIIKSGKYKTGETVYVSRNEAHDLIDSGYGLISKDMVASDIQTRKSVRGARNKRGDKWPR